MDLNFKTYQILKIKNYFRKTGFFFFFQSIKPNTNQWKKNEQELKKLKLKHYKLVNKITLKSLNNSTFKNFNPLICGVIILLKPKFKSTEIKYDLIENRLKNLFNLLTVKLNNKIYSVKQMKHLKNFSYKENMFNFYRFMEKYSKTSYLITKNNTKKSK